jgi:hypothetical protein
MLNKKIFVILSLIFATLACTMSIGGPDYPKETIPVSHQSVEAMQAQFKAAFEAGITGGDIILTITESQLTSYLSSKLESEKSPLFTEPQVHLRDGKITIYGKSTQGYFVANIQIIIAVRIDEEGQPDVAIESADFGPLPVPDSLANALSAIIREAYMGAVGPVATGFRIEKIGIKDGFMVMLGKVK